MNTPELVSAIDQTVHIVAAFTRDGQGGNPAAVVLDADGLSETAMQTIATRTGLSETAFVSHSATEGAKLDFFTPNRRIAHCGHATIATFALLRDQGRIGEGPTSKQTIDGPRRIMIEGGEVFMEQQPPQYHPPSVWQQDGVDLAEVLDSLGLTAEQLDPRFTPHRVSTGNRFLVIAVRSATDLAAVDPDFPAIDRISEALDLIGYYLFTTDSTESGEDATSRMFAPRYGISEESATGMAAGPLASVLHDFFGIKRDRITLGQGRFMQPPAPSLIEVRLTVENDSIVGVIAGGRGQLMETVTVTV